jgi:hypothetical protein
MLLFPQKVLPLQRNLKIQENEISRSIGIGTIIAQRGAIATDR